LKKIDENFDAKILEKTAFFNFSITHTDVSFASVYNFRDELRAL